MTEETVSNEPEGMKMFRLWFNLCYCAAIGLEELKNVLKYIGLFVF